MFYDTTTLEDEERRLKDLVAFIQERIEKRKSLLEDYRTVTSTELTDLEYIEKSGDLDLYEARLSTIKEYLDSSKLIEVNEEDLIKLKDKLIKEYDLKSANEIKNTKIEEELFNAFVNALYEMDLYSSLDLSNIDKEIEKLQKEIDESREQKDTFLTAFNNLKLSGITGDLELEYASYVENSKKNYYFVKEKEIILKLYKLIDEKQSEYSDLYNKREEIKELLQERILLRNELGIKDKDYLAKVSNLLLEQKQEIESEKENVDNINVLTERIKLKENRLDDLRRQIKKPEILSVLKEYSLIDTYDHEDVEEEPEEVVTESKSTEDEIKSAFELLNNILLDDEPKEKIYQLNEIKLSELVPSMNFGLSRLKSISVMKRVGDMLGINAKKEEVKEVPKVEETAVVEVKPEVEVPKQEVIQTVEEPQKQEELFWTPVEFVDMKNETEEQPEIPELKEVPEMVIPEVQLFETPEEQPLFPEIKAETKEQDIFASSNGMMFPEPIMPMIEEKTLPEADKQEDKFMWPDNMETFDLNGIFPN